MLSATLPPLSLVTSPTGESPDKLARCVLDVNTEDRARRLHDYTVAINMAKGLAGEHTLVHEGPVTVDACFLCDTTFVYLQN